MHHYKTRTCEACAITYRPTYGAQRTCSRSCGYLIRLLGLGTATCTWTPPSQCTICGDFTSGKGRRYCSACSSTSHYSGTWIRGTKICDDCSQPITDTYKGMGNYCQPCTTARAHTAKREYKRTRGNHRRRARHYGVTYTPVLNTTVYERDAYACHICGEQTDQTAHHLDDRYPSLDHVIPLSRGGTHTIDNLATAHRICNSIKRDTIPAA